MSYRDLGPKDWRRLQEMTFLGRIANRFEDWGVKKWAIKTGQVLFVVGCVVLVVFTAFSDLSDFMKERSSWNHALTSNDFYTYLSDYGDNGRYRNKAVDAILNKRKVSIEVIQSYPDMVKSVFVLDGLFRQIFRVEYELPIERHLRDVCFEHNLSEVEVRVEIKGKAIVANYKSNTGGGGEVAAGAGCLY
jgi:hypothetical protein